MEDPKYKGNEMEAVYEEQRALPPPKFLYHRSRVDGTCYNEDGSLYETPEAKLAEAQAKAVEIKKEDTESDKSKTLKADEEAADEYGATQARKGKK